MVFVNKKKNAYPEISLHDCVFSEIKLKEHVVCFVFKDGYNLDAEKQTQENAELQINNLSTDNIDIWISKEFRLKKGYMPVYISKCYDIGSVQKEIKKGWRFEIVDEMYSNGKLLWRGEVFKNKDGKRKYLSRFELFINFEDGLDIIYQYNL